MPRVVEEELRGSAVASLIRRHRLIVVLRRIQPVSRVIGIVRALANDGACIFEITMDAPEAAGDLRAVREALSDEQSDGCLVGAGTVRTAGQLRAAVAAGADFGVSPILDRAVLDAALSAGLPFIPGAYTPTEADAAWRAGATFVKLFPASSLSPAHVRELRGPLGEIEIIPTGGIDASNAGAFLDAGAVAVGVGSALVTADAAGRRRILAAVRGDR